MATEWQRRVTTFENEIVGEWRAHRLIPLFFRAAERVAEGGTGARRTGGTERFPSAWFWDSRSPSGLNVAREWGRNIAIEETRTCTTLLSERCPMRYVNAASIRDEIDQVIAEMSSKGLTPAVVLLPTRMGLPSTLLEARQDMASLAGSRAAQWQRGTTLGVPVFVLPGDMTRDGWVIDFAALGTWLQPGDFDVLFVQSELLRDGTVTYDDVQVPATAISARGYFDVEFDDLSAAIGLRVEMPPTTGEAAAT